jgi:hypothetical protein
MPTFADLPEDEQRHEIAALEHQLGIKRELHRRQHGGEMALEGGNGIDVGGKGIKIGAHGPLGILALVFLLLGGSVIYVNYKGFEDIKALLNQSRSDHDLLSCVVSLSPEERGALRSVQHRAEFQRLCPWLRP